MRGIIMAAAVAVLSLWGGAASAADKTPCPAGLVCASKPQTVIDLVKTLSPDAKLDKASDGTPIIKVTDQAYNYSIYFEDCDEGKACAALSFTVSFSPEDAADLAFVNKWNREKRPARAMRDDDGSVSLQFDVSTYGGMNADNFKDVKSWWDSTLDEFSKFFDEQKKAAQAKPKT